MAQQRNKPDQFEEQSFQDQLNILWQRGRLLESRRLPGFWLHLYALDAFYVEMWICQRRYDVSLLRVITSIDDLEPYIGGITLDKLLSG